MVVQLNTDHGLDKGPAWISVDRLNRTWNAAYWHAATLPRWPGMYDANFFDVDPHEEYGISGPHRDGRDTRYSRSKPTIDDDA